jgi:hypothetical protein
VADGLEPVRRVLRAMRLPGYGDYLRAYGVIDLSGYGPDPEFGSPEVYIPPGNEALVEELVDEAFGVTKGISAVETSAQESKRHRAEDELDLGGRYSPVELMDGARAYAGGKRTIEGVQHAVAGLSYRRARRLRSWLEAGAIFWDGRTVTPGRGYQLTRADSESGEPAVRLVRLYPA